MVPGLQVLRRFNKELDPSRTSRLLWSIRNFAESLVGQGGYEALKDLSGIDPYAKSVWKEEGEQPGGDEREAKQSKEVCLGYLKTNVANTCGKKKK